MVTQTARCDRCVIFQCDDFSPIVGQVAQRLEHCPWIDRDRGSTPHLFSYISAFVVDMEIYVMCQMTSYFR